MVFVYVGPQKIALNAHSILGFSLQTSDFFFVIKKGVVTMPTYHIVLDLEMNPVSEVCCYASNGLKTET